MTGLMAKLVAVASVGLLIAAVAILIIGSSPGLRGGHELSAKFDDTYPLLEGNNVRVGGAIAGQVDKIELGDDGKAKVKIRLFDGTDPPRADAIATIRQEDITGDSYVSVSLGQAPEMLGDQTISSKRTMSAPRFDDLLNAFDKPVRQGLRLALVQLGRTLEGRGEDVNRAALELRPALGATNDALVELNSQNRALRSLIGDAHRVTSQAADRSGELSGLIDSLARTLRTTSDRAPELDRALASAPPFARAARGTLARLTRLSSAARPLAVRLKRMAPQLVRGSQLLGPFVDDARSVLGDVDPTLGLTTKLLRASIPTLEANPKRVFTAPFDLTAGIGGLLDSLIGNPTLVRSIFGARCYGGRKCDARGEAGLGAVPVESGRQRGFPASYDPNRFLVRAAAIPSCETFGVPVKPGCLTRVLGNLDRLAGGFTPLLRSAPRSSPRRGGGKPLAPAARSRPAPGAAPRRSPGSRNSLESLLDGALGRAGLGGASKTPKGGRPAPLGQVLDFLLGP